MLSIKLLNTHSLEFFRRSVGYHSGGKYVEPDPPTTLGQIRGSLQSLSPGLAKKILPEGVSTEDSKLFFTYTTLVTYSEFSKHKPDYTTIGGRVFEVHEVGKWDDFGLYSDHNRYLLIAKSQDS